MFSFNLLLKSKFVNFRQLRCLTFTAIDIVHLYIYPTCLVDLLLSTKKDHLYRILQLILDRYLVYLTHIAIFVNCMNQIHIVNCCALESLLDRLAVGYLCHVLQSQQLFLLFSDPLTPLALCDS